MPVSDRVATAVASGSRAVVNNNVKLFVWPGSTSCCDQLAPNPDVFVTVRAVFVHIAVPKFIAENAGDCA
jgi:hypothetical protein